jgi:hypothetical protein
MQYFVLITRQLMLDVFPQMTVYNTTQHNTTQHNTTQHNTTQHNTLINVANNKSYQQITDAFPT